MSNAVEVSSQTFQTEVVQSSLPVVVDFYAPWCGPCKMLGPILDRIAQDYAGRVKVVKVNVDDAGDLANQFNITGVPTMMFFKAGAVVDTIVGMGSPNALKAKFEALAT